MELGRLITAWFLFAALAAAVQGETFAKQLSGVGTDETKSCVAARGGYATIGSLTGDDNWRLVRTDDTGKVVWAKSYDFNSGNIDVPQNICQTADHGFAIVGYTNNGVAIHFCMIKTDSLGGLEFARDFGSGVGNDVLQTADHGYLVSGSTYIVRLDSTGAQLWRKNYERYGGSLQVFPDGGYLFGNMKIDSVGNFIWHRSFDAVNVGSGRLRPDGGYVYTGQRTAYVTGVAITITDMVVVATDSAGNIEFAKKYMRHQKAPEEVGCNDIGYDIQVVPGGGYAIAGTHGNNFDYQTAVTRLDAAGNVVWTKYHSNTGNYKGNLAVTPDNGFLLTREIYLRKTDSLGNAVCEQPDQPLYADDITTAASLDTAPAITTDGTATEPTVTVAAIICTTSEDIAVPAPVITPSGPTTICEGYSVTLNCSYSGVWNTGDTTASLVVYDSGSYWMHTLTSYMVQSETVTVSIISTPESPAAILGPASVCPGVSVVYCVEPVAGATSYTWNVPGEAVIDSGQGTDTVYVTWDTSSMGGDVSVEASSACGYSSSQSVYVSMVRDAPTAPSFLLGPETVIAGDTGVEYQTPWIGNYLYFWSVPPGASITSGDSTRIIYVTFSDSSGYVTVKTATICMASEECSLAVTVTPTTGTKTARPALPPGLFLGASPNPFNPSVCFTFSPGTRTAIRIYNISGRKVADLAVTKERTFWDAAGEPAGLYFARFNVKGGTRILKLMLVK